MPATRSARGSTRWRQRSSRTTTRAGAAQRWSSTSPSCRARPCADRSGFRAQRTDHRVGKPDQLLVDARAGWVLEDGRDLVGAIGDRLLAARRDLRGCIREGETFDPAVLHESRVPVGHVLHRVPLAAQAFEWLTVDLVELPVTFENAERVERLAGYHRPDRLAGSVAVGVD